MSYVTSIKVYVENVKKEEYVLREPSGKRTKNPVKTVKESFNCITYPRSIELLPKYFKIVPLPIKWSYGYRAIWITTFRTGYVKKNHSTSKDSCMESAIPGQNSTAITRLPVGRKRM